LRYPVLLLALALAPVAQAEEHAAHTHGTADLTLVQEGEVLNIALDSPLDNLVGFEHAPANATQHAALADAGKRLADVASVVTLPAEAGCVVSAVDVDLPFSAADAGHAHEADGHGHADVAASYTFACAHPAALRQVAVRLFASFPRIQRIHAEAATDAGQGAATLSREAAQWALPVRR